MSRDSNKPIEERRKRPRRIVAVVADIAGADSERAEIIGMIRDISTIGAHLYTYADLKQGDEVELLLRLPAGPSGPERTRRLTASVVRATPLGSAQRGLYTQSVAVEFAEEVEGFDQEIAELARQAAELLGGD